MRKVVYVLDKDGMPLMPETCPGHVHFLLKNRIAKPVCSHPFTIQQIHETGKGMFRPLRGAIRVGRTDIGVAVIDEAGEILYAAHVTSRNREIPRLVEERAEHRHASRRGERQRRKRRAKKNGTTTEFFWGDSHRDGYGYLNAADTSLVDAGYCFESRFSHDDGFPYTSPVGRFMKNPNGIYDAVGNVLSWTSDWYGTNYGLTEAELNTVQDDPTGPESGSYRVLRGAAWCSPPIGCRSATRYLRAPEFRSDYVGFRVAFEVVDAKDK